MRRIILIQCSKSKRVTKARAVDLYTGTLFRKMLFYAQQSTHDRIFILSSKHRLLELETEIEPYDDFLGQKSKQERKEWARGVLEQLSEYSDLEEDHFMILASTKYCEFLTSHLSHFETPLKGMRIGEQMQYLGYGR